MKKVAVLAGLGILYSMLLAPFMMGSIWLFRHMPDTFDIGYFALIAIGLFISMAIAWSANPVISFLYENTDIFD